jgi:arsenite methyltransferase
VERTKAYFDGVAERWDEMREGFFDEAVRDVALSKAYLRPEMVVADVGCGTGFLTEALATLVSRVHALDASPEMLRVAEDKLAEFDNVEFHLVNEQALPLREASLDALFANMLLHHMPDPAQSIAEMAACLKPDGRLVITDLDGHGQEWLRQEMSDRWLGFDRDQVRRWFHEAGLVNTFVTCTDQACCASSRVGQDATASIFLAVGTRGRTGIRDEVQASYTEKVEEKSCCSTDVSCDCGVPDYSVEEWADLPADATGVAFGCGNPVAIAALRPGEVVLDIGSGGGIDVFFAARQVYPGGKAIGVDMTPAMLERARATAEKMGFTNTEFRQGHAESLPAGDDTVDVILSNCVINLSPDKGRVFGEAFRALRPGGRLSVSDMVTSTTLPEAVRNDRARWASCIGGALPEGEYLDLIQEAGFEALATSRGSVSHDQDGLEVYSLYVTAYKPPVPSAAAAGSEPQAPPDSGCG